MIHQFCLQISVALSPQIEAACSRALFIGLSKRLTIGADSLKPLACRWRKEEYCLVDDGVVSHGDPTKLWVERVIEGQDDQSLDPLVNRISFLKQIEAKLVYGRLRLSLGRPPLLPCEIGSDQSGNRCCNDRSARSCEILEDRMPARAF